MQVLKFGGTSVGKPERMMSIAELITRDDNPKIVVLSALSGTTNALVGIGESLAADNKQEAKEKIATLRNHYEAFIGDLLSNEAKRKEAEEIIEEHFEFLLITLKISYNEALQRDILAQGELMSTKLFTLLLEERGIRAELLAALDFMRTNEDGEPDLAFTETKLPEVLAQHSDCKLFVTQGYICKNHKGEIDNLQRGGSDYTASLIGAAIRAEEVQIWTDIDGMHNNDPRVVDKTMPIAELSFDEAAELAYFGAKILHPASIWPAQKYGIPVKLLNTMQPEAKGTMISQSTISDDVKAVAAKDGIIAIKIKSSRMLLAYGFLRKVFEIFEKYKTPIDMITTSEVAVSVTIDDATNLKKIVKELDQFGQVEVDYKQTIICVVGNFVAEQKGIVNKIFESLSHIPIRMISYGGSRHNISLLTDEEHKVTSLKTLNEHLFGL
ncbi:aspartate kinase [Roseivirga pacifica]|uniref:aspartate kinase n=1 Tax=Roseivirga pacifica TaxID=1267423 RepID=UPI002095A287|nr:aspartate kinase [Roseivirga pacifica]MCO6359091.1 aspartate kinase [Roseivirga pacifica]MCO6365273.1 aspartate kinase [Roseivirga pacifica]MCO6371997.1 aspartate kinase [Roseivirga pacifica]MCO6375892.1 aspartate kinase [Roseivirga pacifica]MCO6379375.1 aspartate kinase [Roseivirga pacifica]